MNKAVLSSLFYAFYFPCMTFIIMIIPMACHLGQLNLIYSVLFFWIIIDPQRIHYSFMIIISLCQDLCMHSYLGVQGCLYAVFMIFLLTQRRQLLNRSFILQWAAFAVTLFILNAIKVFVEFVLYHHTWTIYEIMIDNILPIMIFPIVYQMNAMLYKKVLPGFYEDNIKR